MRMLMMLSLTFENDETKSNECIRHWQHLRHCDTVTFVDALRLHCSMG
jgi:hypothetical protein